MYLTIKEAAERLGLSTKTIFRYIADGKLPAHKLSERCIRIDAAELDEFVKNR